MTNSNQPSSFYVKDCVLASIATGIKAQTISEFRDKIAIIPPGCIFFHFWGQRLLSSFENWEFHNDFSFWAHHCLHDDILAERLEILDPTAHANIENLRSEIIEVLDDRLDELEYIPWTKHDQRFHFIQSKIIVFNTQHKVEKPSELIKIIPLMSPSSIFYHFIDARRRTEENQDDFSAWISIFGDKYQGLIFQLKKIDPFFISLKEIQNKLKDTITKYFLKPGDKE